MNFYSYSYLNLLIHKNYKPNLSINSMPIKRVKFVKEFIQAKKNPLKMQNKVLMKILKHNKHTKYGKKFKFKKIKSIEDFQKKVPVISYDNIKNEIESMKAGKENILVKDKVLFFATSSGTTGNSKTAGKDTGSLIIFATFKN